MDVSNHGFEPENLERIYLGKPALVGEHEELPIDSLSDREYEIAGLIAEGLTYQEIATQLNRSFRTVRNHLHQAYVRLGISSKTGLAGHFPISPTDHKLEGKTLKQLTPRALEVVEGLSQGRALKAVAKELKVSESTARSHTFNAMDVWVDCPNSAVVTRVANGIRANYLRGISENGNGITRHLGNLTLNDLVIYEPKIRSILGMSALAVVN